MSRFRENICRMDGYVPGFQPKGPGYVKLNTNENPFPPSPMVIEAVRAAANDELRKYPDPMCSGFREAAAGLLGTGPERILAGFGSDDLLRMVFMAAVGEGDPVACPYPTYSLYSVLAEMQGAELREIDFPEDYALPDELAATGARLTLLSNPNSPSGTMIAPDRVADLAGRLDGLLVVDEAYVDFAETNCLGLVERFENVIVCRTLSKSYSLAGMRFGFAVAQESVIGQLAKVKDSYNTDRLSQVGAIAAIADHVWMRRNVGRIVENRAFLVSELTALGFKVWPSEANFVLARCPATVNASELVKGLMERKVLVRYFPARRLDDCIRVTVGTREELDILLSELRDLLGSRERASVEQGRD